MFANIVLMFGKLLTNVLFTSNSDKMLTSSWLVLCVGVCTHLVFLASVFDIYFTSPLVHGMQPQRPLQPPPATRLVLISADGLRADKFYSLTADGEPLAPYLTSIGRDSGVWGVSHTRVPTESRPGHVAMVAGVYEDPSAVTRGWKENPVHFDTIFNQSSHTWSWGSPDIVPMLAKGAVPGRVDMSVYGSDQQDFARARPSELDGWVFERVSRLLTDEAAAEADGPQSNSTLRQSGVVFFLHLLGLDTAGHGYKPHSSQYLDNIRFVDDGVKKVVQQFDSFFGDNRTVYVFTSDHGMTDWGSHGAGDPSETETPLVVWGAGVRGPLYTDADTVNPQKLHVEQADLTPLMSALIGIHMPINSVGRLPVSVLSTSAAHRTDALFTNARQLLCQYERRRHLRQRATLPLIYWPYGPLSSAAQTQLVGTLIDYIGRQDWHNAMFLCTELMDMALSGIQYYYTYDRMMLQLSISVCYISWILLLISHLVKTDPSRALTFMLHTKTTSAALVVAFLGTSLAVFLILAKWLPGRYAVYLLLPVLLCSCVVYDTAGLQLAWTLLRSDRRLALKWLALGLGVESLVLAFFQRWVLSTLLVVMTPWPLLVRQGRLRKRLAALWVVTSLLLATYPLSPVVTHQTNYTAVKSAAVISCAVLLIVSLSPELRLVFPRASVREPAAARVVLLLQLILLLVTAGLVHLVDMAVTNSTAVPPPVHSVAWAVLVLSLLLPCLTSSWVLTRLLHVTLGIIAPSILLSLSLEAFFCPLLALHLYVWLRLEHQTDQKQLSCLSFEDPLRRKESIRPAVYDDARRAFFYLFFIVLAFFGIGNLDSINSFDPTSVYAFLTVFNPWIMAALLLTKTLLPFLMVCCYSRAVASVTRMSMERMFLSVLLMLDVMSLHFFFLVTDTGSWQQIGFSISHHVISTGTSLFLLLLHQVARLLTGTAAAPLLQLASRQLHQRRAGSTDPDTVTALKSD